MKPMLSRADVIACARTLKQEVLPKLRDRKIKTRVAIENIIDGKFHRAQVTMAMEALGFDVYSVVNGAVVAWV